MATVAPMPYSPSTMHIPQENRSCGGCHKSVEVDGGGVVVAFGNSLWHVDCFNCAKCGDRVSADTNLLLLSDGSPVCASCTYNCAVCKNPISDEAIMTGDESYHAACFSCRTCGRHIGELVFAKTSQGIYCMACHNERVARSRRHAEQRRNRSKSRRDGHRDKEKERLQEKPSYTQLRDTSLTSIDPQSPPGTPGLHQSDITAVDAAVSYAAKRISTLSIAATLQNSRHPAMTLKSDALPPPPASPTIAQSLPSPTITTTHAPPQPSSSTNSPRPNTATTGRGDTLPLPYEPEYLGPRRKSFDDGIQSLGGLLSPEDGSSLTRAPSTSLGRTSRTNKRASITPGVRLDWTTNQTIPDAQMQHSPVPLSPTGNISARPQTPQLNGSRDLHERSASPYHQDLLKRTSTPQSSRSRPSSPSVVNISHTQSTVEKNVDIQEMAKPQLQRNPSSQHTVSGRTSPAPHLTNGIVNGVAGATVQRPFQRVNTPDRDLPKLPVEPESEDEQEQASQEEQRDEQTQEVPIALPPMSFSESDTNFNDLLKFGTRRSTQSIPPIDIEEEPDDDDMDIHVRDRFFEAGPSKASSPRTSVSPPPVSPPPVTKSPSPPATKPSSPVPPPLNNLPKRSVSLARKMSARKPVPKAILLPDTFEGDTTIEKDDSSNGHSSPRSMNRHNVSRKASDPVGNPVRRPASAGTGAPPPLSPGSKARRSSDNATPGSPLASITGPTRSDSKPLVTITDTGSNRTTRPMLGRQDTAELVAKRIKEALADAQGNGASTVRLDREFLEVIYLAVQNGQEKIQEMRTKFDKMRRTSQQFVDGLSVAQEEYDKELSSRRDAEAEVTRLKIQLSGQAARLTQLSAEERKREMGEQMSRDMSANLDDLERDLSRVIAERDLAVAEVEELAASKMAKNHGDGGLQRSLTHRFDNLKSQYKKELEPLLQQREALLREINELKEERNICLEETTALNARNEELAELNMRTSRQTESGGDTGAMRTWSSMPAAIGAQPQQQQLQQQQQQQQPQQSQQTPSTPKMSPLPPVPQGLHFAGSTTSFSVSQDERDEHKSTPNEKKPKWFKPSREPMKPINDTHAPQSSDKELLKHNFQLLTVLRLARCDHCGDKMWGTQLRCTTCHMSCHNRCMGQVTLLCSLDSRPRDEVGNVVALQPTMFGRDLIEQVRADSLREHRDIPVIVEKCIEAVELLAMDYEGVYRKSGGSAQSKVITQLFERGNYDAFNLGNSDTFNDISSVTSVLKTYFRQLPNPLLTNALHEAFVSAAILREQQAKANSLTTLVYQLPSEHFHTLRYLMLHLYRVQLRSAENLMNARNLGVVFGPTLMRSSDPNREFADMAGKALAIEWLVENAPSVFREDC